MLPACLFVTGACAWLYAIWKIDGVLPLLIFFKAITLLLFFFLINTLKTKEFYYYYNLGVSKARLLGTVAAVDLAVFAAVIVSTFYLFIK
jgi:hypothetical protein